MYLRKAIAQDGLYSRGHADIGDQEYAELIVQLQATVDRQPIISTSKSMGYAAAVEPTYGPKNWTKSQVIAQN